ncbi:MAG: DUF309 domain-containing protein [Bdellovibrionales bacterium]|nr:DUF309 domain-containing protein [Bdellovibrionales bacterium]
MSAQTTLDEIWLHEESELKNFYGGLIQLAVSFYHLMEGNGKGSKKIFEKALELLQPYKKIILGLDVQTLLSESHIVYQNVADENVDIAAKSLPKIILS